MLATEKLDAYTVTEKRPSPLAVRVSPDLAEAIKKTADQIGETVPAYVRRILQEVTSDLQQTRED